MCTWNELHLHLVHFLVSNAWYKYIHFLLQEYLYTNFLGEDTTNKQDYRKTRVKEKFAFFTHE